MAGAEIDRPGKFFPGRHYAWPANGFYQLHRNSTPSSPRACFGVPRLAPQIQTDSWLASCFS